MKNFKSIFNYAKLFNQSKKQIKVTKQPSAKTKKILLSWPNLRFNMNKGKSDTETYAGFFIKKIFSEIGTIF